MRQYVVGRMATRAYGGDLQALLEQALRVHAVLVIFEDEVLGDVARLRHRRVLRVALRAHVRNVDGVRGRFRVARRLDGVGRVAIRAGRRERVLIRNGLPVETLRVNFRFVLVAGAAVDGLQRFRVREFGNIRVAGDTPNALVYVAGVRRLVNEQGLDRAIGKGLG